MAHHDVWLLHAALFCNQPRYGGDYFYLAELIEASTAEATSAINCCLVAEVDGKAVGMMSLSTSIDLKVISVELHTHHYFI